MACRDTVITVRIQTTTPSAFIKVSSLTLGYTSGDLPPSLPRGTDREEPVVGMEARITHGVGVPIIDPGAIGGKQRDVDEHRALEEVTAIVACNASGAHVVEDVPGADRVALVDALARAYGPTLVLVPSHEARTRLASKLSATSPVTIAFSYQLVAWATTATAFEASRALRRTRQQAAPRVLRAAARAINFDIDALDAEVAADVAKRLATRKPVPNCVTGELAAAYRECEALAEGTCYERVALVSNDPSLLASALDTRGVVVVVLFDPEIQQYAIASPLVTLGETRTIVVVTNPRRMREPFSRKDLRKLIAPGYGHHHELSVACDRSQAVTTGLVRIDTIAPGATTVMTTQSVHDGAVIADIYPDYLQLLDALTAGLVALPGVTAKRGRLVDLADVAPLDLACRDGRGQQILVVGPTRNATDHVRDQLTNAIEHIQDLSSLAQLWIVQIAHILGILDPDHLRDATDRALEDGTDGEGPHERISPVDIIDVLWDRDHPDRRHASVPELAGIAQALQVDGVQPSYVELGEHAIRLLNELTHTAPSEIASFAARAKRVITDHIALLDTPGPRQVSGLLEIAHNIYDLRAHGSRQAGTGLERWLPSASAVRVATGDRLVAARALEARADAARRHPADVLATPEADEAVIGTIHAHAAGMREVDHLLIVATTPGHFPATHVMANPDVEACLWQSLWSMTRQTMQFVGVRRTKFLDKTLFPGEVRVHRGTSTR